jgi:hypothetical protein
MQRHGGKAGDEHDLERGIAFGGALGQFDSVHAGITISVSNRSKLKPCRHSQASPPSPKSVTAWPALTNAARKELAEGFVVFCQ